MTGDEFRKYWEMITPEKVFTIGFGPKSENQMYQGVKSLQNLK
jgi:hypothetical protein